VSVDEGVTVVVLTGPPGQIAAWFEVTNRPTSYCDAADGSDN
jgi:hypothetical protein